MTHLPYPDRFYPVVDSIRTLMDIARLGVGTIQLRVKGLDDAQATALVREAVESVEGLPVRLVINDYWRAPSRAARAMSISGRRISPRPMSPPSAPPG